MLTTEQIQWLKDNITNYTINSNNEVDVKGNVDISNKQLTSIPVQFGYVSGSFWCFNNQLTSLEHAPKEVGGSFICSGNRLTSLQGAPREIGGHFNCRNNKLTSLQYAPKKVGGDFYCDDNKLASLQGLPTGITYLTAIGNPLTEWTEDLMIRVISIQSSAIKLINDPTPKALAYHKMIWSL